MYKIAFGIIIGLLFISLLVLFCILIVKLHINKVKNYTGLIYQKDIDFQKTLNATIMETQEQALNNISRDLHDDAGQQLTYINFQLENLKLDFPNLNGVLDPLSQSVGNLSESIRSVSHSLNNQLILQQDIVKAVTTEVERLKKNPKTKINLTINQEIKKELSANEKIVIYRIFQEIINNCFKHAKAKQINILIKTYPEFVLCVSDNGNGFDYQETKNNKLTLGLQNMEHRASIINYHLEVLSILNKGTTVTLSEKI
jgi:signal transduction histidine kinase